MSILIKGMEMPTSPVLFCIHPDGKVFADLEGGWREYQAVPVPPHGRLIDADALMKQVEHDTPLSDVYEKTMRRYLNNAQTIIEAEE